MSRASRSLPRVSSFLWRATHQMRRKCIVWIKFWQPLTRERYIAHPFIRWKPFLEEKAQYVRPYRTRNSYRPEEYRTRRMTRHLAPLQRRVEARSRSKPKYPSRQRRYRKRSRLDILRPRRRRGGRLDPRDKEELERLIGEQSDTRKRKRGCSHQPVKKLKVTTTKTRDIVWRRQQRQRDECVWKQWRIRFNRTFVRRKYMDGDYLLHDWLKYHLVHEPVRASPLPKLNFNPDPESLLVSRILAVLPECIRVVACDKDHAIFAEFPHDVLVRWNKYVDAENLACFLNHRMLVIRQSSVRFVSGAQLAEQFGAGYSGMLRNQSGTLVRDRGVFQTRYAVLSIEDFHFVGAVTGRERKLKPWVYDTNVYREVYEGKLVMEQKPLLAPRVVMEREAGLIEDELEKPSVEQMTELGFPGGKVSYRSEWC